MAQQGTTDLRTTLGKVKGLGSAKHGTGHWWVQRVTAVALIPLTVWFVVSLIPMVQTPNVVKVAEWLASPVNALLMVLLMVSAFMHARLGNQVVIEDYIKSPVAKYTLLLANTFICYLFAGISIIAVLKLHLLDVTASM